MNIAVGIERMGGCEYIRTLVPYAALAQRGHRVIWSDRIIGREGHGFPIGTILARDFKGAIHALADADAFVLQRVTERTVLEACKALQARGRTKIVYEFDDNFHAMPSHNPHAKDHGPGKEATRVLDEFVAMADLVTVSTEGLRAEFSRLRGGKPIAVCPNALDDHVFARYARPYDGAPKRDGEIRIGWAGSGTHLGDLQMVVPALCAIMDEFPRVRLVFVGADMRGLFPERFFQRPLAGGLVTRPSRVEFAGQTYTTNAFHLSDLVSPAIAPIQYYDLVVNADVDIAVAPIEPNTFNAAKSWIKALEYGMLSVPMVLSNFGPYRDFARGAGETVALLASEKREWVRHLRDLVASADRRASLAAAAHAHVAARHTIAQGIASWEDALRQLAPADALAAS